MTLKWLSPKGLCPSCPLCWRDSSLTSKKEGEKEVLSFSSMRVFIMETLALTSLRGVKRRSNPVQIIIPKEYN